jgi:hypothetical protein
MPTLELQSHPTTPCAAVRDIQVTARRPAAAQFQLEYRVIAAASDLIIPATAAAALRRDELWQHTCAELFVTSGEQQGYCEFNFSPSTEWAAYEFSSYRQGMRALPLAIAPRIASIATATELLLSVTLDLTELPAHYRPADLRLALCMVIEARDSRISYWALNHPTNKPDFHHADGFAFKLRE